MEFVSSTRAGQYGHLECPRRGKRNYVDTAIPCPFHFILSKKNPLIRGHNVCMDCCHSAHYYFNRFPACARLALEYYSSRPAISWHVRPNASTLADRNGLR